MCKHAHQQWITQYLHTHCQFHTLTLCDQLHALIALTKLISRHFTGTLHNPPNPAHKQLTEETNE